MTDRRTRLAPGMFEAIQTLKHHWRKDLVDFAADNVEIAMAEFEELELLEATFTAMEGGEREEGVSI